MKQHSHGATARVLVAIPFLLSGVFFAVLAFSNLSAANRDRAARPALDAPNPTQFGGTYDPHVFPCATPRHHFTVPAGTQRIVVLVSAAVPTDDLSVTLLFGPDPNPVFIQTTDTGTSSEALLYQPGGGVMPGEYQVQICQTPTPNGVPQMPPYTYNGIFTTDDTAANVGPTPPPFGPIPPAPQSQIKVGFENYTAPGALIPVTTTSAGLQVASVEYMGRNSGEPSIGNNWRTDTTVFYSDLESLFVKFNDTCPANGLSATWVNRQAPTAQGVDSDPIGFTDSALGRSFSGQLTLLTPTCKTSFTDDDGQTWVPSQGSGLASGVDHQTIGGGRYAAPLDALPPNPIYPHAVYYCSQEGVPAAGPPAFCSRSDDGGLTFGPSVPLYVPTLGCGGLHGHVKVSPKDGSVYVPFNTCGGIPSVVVSENNGASWEIRHVSSSTTSMKPSASFQDPAVSIDSTGRLYFVHANNDVDAAVATSDDNGKSWQNLGEVSSVYGLKNIRYPAATAGDAGRAAVAFYGTTTAGDALLGTFPGVWHLFVANTVDGGVHWSTTDATPNAPMQRGCIWAKGGASICRNLLDFFDMTVDKFGRALVGYVNGCEGGPCVQAPINAQGETPILQGNAYTDAATIARQSSGPRLFFANDPVSPTSKPGMPLLTQRRIGNVVHLQWSEADTGNSAITGYQILRGTTSNGETFHANVTGTQTGGTFDDALPAGDVTTYYYKVVAMNALGSSCGNNEVVAPYVGNTCTGIIIHRNDPTHPEANEAKGNTPPQLLIDYVSVAEPPGTNNFVFRMKVNDLTTPPPNSRWRIAWDSFAAETYPGVPNPDPTGDPLIAQQFYVGMTTGPTGAPTFEYGTLADAGLPAVFVIGETKRGDPLPGTGYTADGLITIVVPKTAFGPQTPSPTAPPVGTLLGAVNGRTLTGDVPGSQESKLERSNAFTDHTFVKAQTDQSYPASTYLVSGNNVCPASGLAPIGAVSRKTHTGQGDFDIDLPLAGNPGVEPRHSANNSHRIVVTFAAPVTVGSANVTGTGSVQHVSTNGSNVTIDLTGVADKQTISVNLVNVSDGVNTGNISIPMGVLLGDTNGDRTDNSADAQQTRNRSGQVTDRFNFRSDVNTDGVVNSGDATVVRNHSGNSLDP